VKHQPRKTGKSTYTFFKKLRVLRPVISFALLRVSLLIFFSAAIVFLLSVIFKTGSAWAALSCVIGSLSALGALTAKLLLIRARKVEYVIEKVVRSPHHQPL
jgi:hypothetical protein